MNRNLPLVSDVLNRCKDDLIDVGVLLERTEADTVAETVPAMDLKLRSAYQVADACRRLEILFRPSRYAEYDPPALLRSLSGQLPALTGGTDIHVEEMGLSMGDVAQIFECVRLTCRNHQMQENGHLRVAATAKGGAARIVFKLEKGGEPPSLFDLDGVYLFDLDELRGRWHTATRGGVIDLNPGGMAFYLDSDVLVPEPDEDYDTAREAALTSLSRRLRPWRGAIGDYEPGYAGPDEVLQLYRKTVAAALDDASRVAVGKGVAPATA